MSDRDLALAVRQAVLMIVDALEKWMVGKGWLRGPLTAELRHETKKQP